MANHEKRIIISVCVYHIVIFYAFVYYITSTSIFDGNTNGISSLIILSAFSGAAGATLVASRYVVIAVKNKSYDLLRLPWQLLTPLHGMMLAIFAFFLINAKSVTGENSPIADPVDVTLTGILVGFAAEIFVKRLISVAEAVFGEGSKSTTIDDVQGGASGKNAKQRTPQP